MRSRCVRKVLNLSASAIFIAPTTLILLSARLNTNFLSNSLVRSRCIRKELDLSASAILATPSGPILLSVELVKVFRGK